MKNPIDVTGLSVLAKEFAALDMSKFDAFNNKRTPIARISIALLARIVELSKEYYAKNYDSVRTSWNHPKPVIYQKSQVVCRAALAGLIDAWFAMYLVDPIQVLPTATNKEMNAIIKDYLTRCKD